MANQMARARSIHETVELTRRSRCFHFGVRNYEATRLAAIKKDRVSLYISVVTSWEIALLYKKGRLLLPVPSEEFVELALRHYGV